ncbi:hypothetical protein HYU23_02270 [Candidatus Woesearchaeota archaeon]|nr:hypothetical protein [Candidatus Woesearchaeota archaeon]
MVQLKYWDRRPCTLVLEDGKSYQGVVKHNVFAVYDGERAIYIEGRGIAQNYIKYSFVTSSGQVISLSRNGIHRVSAHLNADASRTLTRRIGYDRTINEIRRSSLESTL